METLLSSPRVLMIESGDAVGLTDRLLAAGADVVRVRSVAEGAETVHDRIFDAVVLCAPIPDADLVAACAALADVGTAPPVVLIDDVDQSAALARILPTEMQPCCTLVRPVEVPKLLAVVGDLVAFPERFESTRLFMADQLAKLLGELACRNASGVLQVRSEGVVTRIYFQKGRPVNAEGGSLRETLGRLLLRLGTVSEADYARVIERMTENVIHNEYQRMGEVLVELGLLSTSEVYRALSEQVAEKIQACFQWANFEHEFQEMDGLPEGSEPFEVAPLESLVLTGLGVHVDREAIVAQLRDSYDLPVFLERPVGEIQGRYRLGSSSLHLLERLKGGESLGQLLEDEETTHLLAALIWLGDAGCAEATEPALAEPKPPRRQPLARVQLVHKTSAELAKPAAAPTAESDAAPERARTLQAEARFRAAQNWLDRGELSEAASAMKQVVALQPMEPEYRMVEAWVAYLEGGEDRRFLRAEVIAMARKAGKADPRGARPHAILGRVALDDDDLELARREFEAALARDPKNADAASGLQKVRDSQAAG
jgi:tetratricopeptide (TPR) repeat protein